MFSFEEDDEGLVRATVTLPNSVHPAVRRTTGKSWWRTERAARKEAAFQTYKALWEYGLVNDNLLPLTRKPELRFTEEVDLPAIVEGSEQCDPYVELAHAWASPEFYRTGITVSNDGNVNEDLLMSIVLPKSIPMPEPIPLYWGSDATLTVSFSPSTPLTNVTMETIQIMREITAIYLQAPTSRVRGPERDFVALFVPNIPDEQLEDWTCRYEGSEKALDFYARDATTAPEGIIRDTARYSEPRLFRKWIVSGDEGKPHIELECQSLPRRRNLLQIGTLEVTEPKIHVIPASGCTFDRLPTTKAIFGLFISAILDRLEAMLVANKLNETILKGVGIQDVSHVITAITTPIAQATVHYQLYEFFGDSVLKFTVSCQLFFLKPTWHEGYLSGSRDQIIQNKRLARAALETGLDSFILTNRFTPRKWNPPLISQKSTTTPGKRQLSTKVLADVVEALIGAAYMDGGIHKAQACLHRFLPEIDIFTSDIVSVGASTGRGVSNLVDHHCIGYLIGYTFNDASVLTEALTHPSCEYDTTTQSYQRIEYLGDAVLDMVVVSVLAAQPNQISQGKMTLIKHAVVNANLLAFLCMDLAVPDQTAGGQIALWRFLRFHGPTIQIALRACLERYRALRDEIRAALQSAAKYPWELFACLHADKFISDIVESTLGAIFIDSGGNLSQCEAFAERIGLLPYLRRVIAETVDVEHPRNAAQNLVKGIGNLAFKTKRVEKKGGVATYRCSAELNKEVVAAMEECSSAEEAEVKVSHLVIEKMKQNGT